MNASRLSSHSRVIELSVRQFKSDRGGMFSSGIAFSQSILQAFASSKVRRL